MFFATTIQPLLSSLSSLWGARNDGRLLTRQSHTIPHHHTVFTTITLASVSPAGPPTFLLRDEYRELYELIKESIDDRTDVQLFGQQGCGKHIFFRFSAFAADVAIPLRVTC